MAYDLFKRSSTGNDFSRGEPPPATSVEWSFMPQSAADMMAKDRGKTKPSAKTSTTSGSEPGEKKSGGIFFVAAGFVVGLILGSWGRTD